MNKEVDLIIYIVSPHRSIEDLEDYDPEEIGTNVCKGNRLIFNKVEDGYSLIIDNMTLARTNYDYLIQNMIRIMRKNLPNTDVNVSMEYLYRYEDGRHTFSKVTAQSVLMFDNALRNICEKEMDFDYIRSRSIYNVAKLYQNDVSVINDSREEVGYGQDNDPFSFLNRAIHDYEDDDYEDEEEEDDYKPKKKKKKSPSVNASKVVKNSKNPKREYNRHGVIIARDKDDVRKDARTIRKFLKQFIPGDAGWKQDLRDDLEERWMRTFAVSTKKLKKLEKAHRRAYYKSKKPSINTQRTLEITRRMFNVPIDNWNNPDK